MKPLTIVAYFDGRLGHEKQTRGVLQALAALTPTNVIHKNVKISPAASCRNWVAYLLSYFRILNTEHFFGPADLIIGTGTHTHIPMLLEKDSRFKLSGEKARVVTCMTPEPLLRGRFDLCCVPRHDDPPPLKNVFVTLGPPCPVRFEKRHNPDRGLILLGGVDKKSHTWNSGLAAEQIQAIIDREPAWQWTVSSSPRTPEDTCRGLEAMAATREHLTFYRSKDTPPGWVEEQYALHNTVWVTADSISMVYEALSGGCSVGILPVEWLRPDNKFQKSLNFLHEKKMIVYFEEWQAGAPMPPPPAEPFNEAARCAREILGRWWPERLAAGKDD
jgi:mitochondrial fission protein ELM1